MVSVPCRGTTFLNQIYMNCIIINISVSVPCRGTTFLNNLAACPTPQSDLSFRPLSGNYISQLKMGILTLAKIRFPSPVGELHFSIGSMLVPCKAR